MNFQTKSTEEVGKNLTARPTATQSAKLKGEKKHLNILTFARDHTGHDLQIQKCTWNKPLHIHVLPKLLQIIQEKNPQQIRLKKVV